MREKITENSRLMEEWDWEKNGELGLNPEEITAGSNKKAWWKCKKGHKWDAIIASRAQGSGCPICANKKTLAGYNDLATTHPQLAKEWHPTKNNELTPDMFSAGSNKKVWWQCKQGHEWQAYIGTRASQKTRCPVCCNKKVIVGINDLETYCKEHGFSDFLKLWCYEKNDVLGITPKNITVGSAKKVYWNNREGITYSNIRDKFDSFLYQINSSSAVKFNIKRSVPYNSSFPEKAVAFYLSKYFNIVENYRPDWLQPKEIDIFIPLLNIAIEYDGSTWHQDKTKDEHKSKMCFENNITLIRLRTKKCPKLSVNYDIIIDAGNSGIKDTTLAIIELLLYLGVQEDMIDVDIHRDVSLIRQKTQTKFYQNSFKKWCIDNNRTDFLNMWHPTKNGDLNPENFSYSSGQYVWWMCKKCGKEWQNTIDNTRRKNLTCRCSKPFRSRVIKGVNDLQTKAPKIASQWHPVKNGNLTPNDISAGSTKKVWWLCPDCGDEWFGEIRIRVKRQSDCCPECAKKKRVKSCKKTIAQRKSNSLKTA